MKKYLYTSFALSLAFIASVAATTDSLFFVGKPELPVELKK